MLLLVLVNCSHNDNIYGILPIWLTWHSLRTSAFSHRIGNQLQLDSDLACRPCTACMKTLHSLHEDLAQLAWRPCTVCMKALLQPHRLTVIMTSSAAARQWPRTKLCSATTSLVQISKSHSITVQQPDLRRSNSSTWPRWNNVVDNAHPFHKSWSDETSMTSSASFWLMVESPWT